MVLIIALIASAILVAAMLYRELAFFIKRWRSKMRFRRNRALVGINPRTTLRPVIVRQTAREPSLKLAWLLQHNNVRSVDYIKKVHEIMGLDNSNTAIDTFKARHLTTREYLDRIFGIFLERLRRKSLYERARDMIRRINVLNKIRLKLFTTTQVTATETETIKFIYNNGGMNDYAYQKISRIKHQ